MRNNKEKGTREKKFILTDNRNGITLIALVVTIVVLLILAGVSISLILDNNGVIQKSKDARREYGQASENEQKELSGLSDWIETAVGKIEYNEELKALKPGDYIIYDTGIEGVGEVTCRVLYDAESPYNLQIITDDCIKKDDGEYVYIPFADIDQLKWFQDDRYKHEIFTNYDFSEYDKYRYKSTELYNDAIEVLNNKAMEYFNDQYAVDARCVGSNPINKDRETKSIAELPEDVVTELETSSNKVVQANTGLKDEDDNFVQDYNTLQDLNLLTTTKHYWFASRYNEVGPVYEGTKGMAFYLRTDGASEFNWLIARTALLINALDHNSSNCTRSDSNIAINALRPVFTLKGNLKVVSGDGNSESTAYRLGV